MSYNENFKGMLALTYCKQSANMSKQSENTNLTNLQKQQAIKIQQRNIWLLTNWEQGQS